MELINLSFEEWVGHIFDHPVAEPAWHWNEAADYWAGSAQTTVEYITRLLENPAPTLERFSDAQLNQGFWFLISTSEHLFALTDEQLSQSQRERALRATFNVFRDIFARRCSPYLSYFRPEQSDDNPLNSVCYMWWDVFGCGRLNNEDVRVILEVITSILELPSIACIESALHGLGEWHLDSPDEVEAIVDAFLAANPMLRPDLKSYAQNARIGNVP